MLWAAAYSPAFMSHFFRVAGSVVDQIKINILSREIRDGRVMWIKRRRWAAGPITACANRFFDLAHNPVHALHDLAAWQRWEIGCFLRLHGEGFRAFPAGARAIAADEVPGRTLAAHLDDGTLSAPMLVAAARELRRAHACRCPEFGGAWSHGDPHAGNFIYDRATDRARLIDFEVMHHRSLPAEERHADDLLVFLQDLVGRVPAEEWLRSAWTFLEAYDQPEIAAQLQRRLVVPGGFARVWWAVRTTYLSPIELAGRVEALRASLRSRVRA